MLRHRGPDDEGFLAFRHGAAVCLSGQDTPEAVVRGYGRVDGPIAPLRSEERLDSNIWNIGHRRLAILDLSEAGHQPMAIEHQRLWIAFNGEVYNFVELRYELEASGARFSTGTDTEVVLAAYAKWGTGCFARMRGMWALAIIDLQSGQIVLCRDAYGIKPLYIRSAGDSMAFASEIKAFTVLDDWSAKSRLDGIADFLLYEQTDHREESLFDGVRQLPAGCFLRLPLSGDLAQQVACRPERWYDLRAGVQSAAGAVSDVRALIDESVRLHLRADVPVGSCLSGGIDSSSIVALASRRVVELGAGRLLRTITASAEDRRIDETRFAALAAEAAGATSDFISPSPDKLLVELDQLIWHQDEPFASSSIFAQWCVFERARQLGLTVMLDGQGADEAFGGYRGFLGAFLAEEIKHAGVRRWLAGIRDIRSGSRVPIHRLIAYTVAYAHPRFRRALGLLEGRSFAERSWLAPAFTPIVATRPDPRQVGDWSTMAGMSIDMIERSNLPMLLRWEDRNSMAFSIEARVPFVDRKVVEAALAMPSRLKLARGIQKQALRVAMRGLVPDTILDRTDKLGFLSSEEVWMRRTHSRAFRKLLRDAVEGLPHILSPKLLDDFEAMCAGRKKFDYRYWRCICLDRWRRRFAVHIPSP
jgi:asparagine synthase (glutamine-hydrolysing)